MGLKQIILPLVTQAITSEKRLLKRRQAAEKKRIEQRAPHRVTFYHRIDDPYSHLLLMVLVDFRDRFGIEVETVVVLLEMTESYYPAPEMLEKYALRDVMHLAALYGLPFPETVIPPDRQTSLLASRILLSITDNAGRLEFMRQVGDAFWKAEAGSLQSMAEKVELLTETAALRQLRANQQRLEKNGHYLSGMLHYGGEWYWGLDRLGHLEQRLLDLGLSSDNRERQYNRQIRAFSARPASKKVPPETTMDFFFSFRSPYSYIAIERACELADRYGARLKIKPVLPMVMRGMTVPSTKRMYIVRDAKREAVQAGVPFGRIYDPVGPGTERAFSLFRYAESEQKERSFILSIARGSWAEGIDIATDRGLKICVERCGLDWKRCQLLLADQSWRNLAEANRQEMFELGSWGVPTFRLGDIVVWGQDRFWVLEETLREMTHE